MAGLNRCSVRSSEDRNRNVHPSCEIAKTVRVPNRMAGWPGRSGLPENGGTTIWDLEPREVRKEPRGRERLDSKPREIREAPCGRKMKKRLSQSRVKYEKNRAVGTRERLNPKPRQLQKEPRGRDSKKAQPEAAPSSRLTRYLFFHAALADAVSPFPLCPGLRGSDLAFYG
ncbi:hypothetical protein MRX96_041693 [Rhipicephalus microplus]